MSIQSCHALEILDSRGNPTLSVTVISSDGYIGKASIPSGASTGEHEAIELRDGDPKRYQGKGVLKAIANVEGPLNACVKGLSIFAQQKIDEAMLQLDGSTNKKNMGANAILGISLAVAKCASLAKGMPLYRYLGGHSASLLPCPMMNIINGGVHADSGLDFQELMIRPRSTSFSEAVRCGAEVFQTLKKILSSRGFSTSVGDEGGFAPALSSHEQAIEYILEAIETAGYTAGKEVTIALDCAASEFYKNGLYRNKSYQEQVSYLEELVKKYPIDSIEDGLDQNDWEGWAYLTARLGNKIQLVGDDIFVTNTKFLQRGIHDKVANAILIKVNQIGTLSETIATIQLAQKNKYKTIISHRSGETEDTTIADLAVAFSTGQIKTGSLSRSERTAKYNRLLEIEKELKNSAKY